MNNILFLPHVLCPLFITIPHMLILAFTITGNFKCIFSTAPINIFPSQQLSPFRVIEQDVFLQLSSLKPRAHLTDFPVSGEACMTWFKLHFLMPITSHSHRCCDLERMLNKVVCMQDTLGVPLTCSGVYYYGKIKCCRRVVDTYR